MIAFSIKNLSIFAAIIGVALLGQGCMTSSTKGSLIEKNDDFSTKVFLEFLEKKMDEIAEKIPNTELDFNDFDNIKNAR